MNLILFKLLKDESNYGHYTLSSHDLTQYMKLDYAGVKALDLMPPPNHGKLSYNDNYLFLIFHLNYFRKGFM
jgi:DNA mismatch repair protein MSH2